mmetsp:Transcript_8824/g.18876  ORF Transcript_8824/g.18876 Transcript_8824/m.18876 type:complete len:443 (+) Transcript_8824:44-1372(+)|eukprot:CAMPEP_0202895038 /NCGR_PEP_ID=MMETSP1392-20130828/4318_1 /ASSEMBLY_ACC=CAM_ASM_000868 /TAXON_ID=225041 /ORGANISM="Chlamydomonas chlamydogama, Strain SAG 11-48b" /LENGTH=442 /DNA_ID=CAMNT_0049579913 /DNA_START=27 /DNA_END=1355 /DNA_ORIENTATION=-
MSDIKDILGVPRQGAPAEKAEPKPKKEKMKRPEGMSREAFALLGDSHPIISSQLVSVKKKDMKAKPKPSTKGIPTWQYKPFKNSARTDGLELFRWVKGYKDLNGRMREPEDTEYYFAKFNKKIQLFKYTNEEYEALIRGDSGDWSKEETDYLFDLCERFDLRFTLVADRYEFAGTPAGASRSLEDLKDRYYSIARRLLVAREGGEAAVANHVLVKHPFNRQHEAERKAAIHLLLTRGAGQVQEENVILAEARQIEERRRSEAGASARRAAATSQQAGTPGVRTASPATAMRPSSAAAAGAAAAAPSSVGLTPTGGPPGDGRFPAEFVSDPGPGVPSLFDLYLNPSKPPAPGVYVRSACTSATAQAMGAAMSGGARAYKNVETLLTELGWSPLMMPRVNTRAVCGQWLAMRGDVIALYEARRNLQNRSLASSDEKKKSSKKKG